jgi:hypothetical protein
VRGGTGACVVGPSRSPPSLSAVAPHPRAGCCGVSGPSPSAALDGSSEPSKRRRRTRISPPGWGRSSTRHPLRAYRDRCAKKVPNAGQFRPPCTVWRRSTSKVNREKVMDQPSAPRAESKYRAGPDAAGATRQRERLLMRQEPLNLLRFSSETLERAGRRPALSFSDLHSRFPCKTPKGELTPSSPGLTASIPAAQEWRSGQGCLSLRRACTDGPRFTVAAGRRRPRGQSPYGL